MLEKMEEASTTSTGLARRKRSTAEKRQIVEETHREGASVRSVARAHDIPSNQLFHWRKLYREGRLGNRRASNASELVAVRLLDVAARIKQPNKRRCNRQSLRAWERFRSKVEKGRLCIQGAADPATLRVVLERLLG